MRMQDLVDYVKAQVPYKYYAYSYPTTAQDNSALIIIGTGLPTRETLVRKPSVQILVRGTDIPTAEAKAYELYNALKYKRDFLVGDANVAEFFATQSAPLFIGLDEANRAEFSLNFMATIRP